MNGGLVFHVRVSPGARRAGVGGMWIDADGGQRLIVRVSAPPENGKANNAACEAVAEAFGLPRSAVAVTAGAKSRQKTLSIDATFDDAMRARLAALMEGGT